MFVLFPKVHLVLPMFYWIPQEVSFISSPSLPNHARQFRNANRKCEAQLHSRATAFPNNTEYRVPYVREDIYVEESDDESITSSVHHSFNHEMHAFLHDSNTRAVQFCAIAFSYLVARSAESAA